MNVLSFLPVNSEIILCMFFFAIPFFDIFSGTHVRPCVQVASPLRKVCSSCKCQWRKEVLERVAQHGHQLFEERGRNVQWAFGDGENQYDRLEGLRTEFSDWHAKVTLYKVLIIIAHRIYIT